MAFLDGAIETINRKKAATHALLKNWAGQLEGEAKTGATWKDRTGNTRQGIHSDVEANGDDGEIILFLAHSQRTGTYLEEGTGIHGPNHQSYEINPNNKRALFWPGADHPVKKIVHPGMKARPIIEPTLNDNLPRIKQTLFDLWED